MRLHEIAHARTGDKGDISNISVVAYRQDDFALIEKAVTEVRVAAHFGTEFNGEVKRYLLPQLGALNLVITGALSGGVTRSLALDAHGKCLSSILLEMEIGL